MPTTFSSTARVLQARVLHFSVWSWIKKNITGITDDRPSCTGTPPWWAQVNLTALGGAATYGIVASCAGKTADGMLQVRVISSHAGPSYVRFLLHPTRITLDGIAVVVWQSGGAWYAIVPDGGVLEADFAQSVTTFQGRQYLYGYAGEDGLTYIVQLIANALNFSSAAPTLASVTGWVVECSPQIAAAIRERTTRSAITALKCLDSQATENVRDIAIRVAISRALHAAIGKVSLWVDAYKAGRDFEDAVFAAGEAPAVIDAYLTTTRRVEAPTVSIINPGGQTSVIGSSTSMEIHASASNGGALTYSATGLPPGLSINRYSGVISGTPTTVGTSTVTITATSALGGSGHASFGWSVVPSTLPPPVLLTNWKVADIGGVARFTDVSCASASFCMAVAGGEAWWSDDSAGGVASWHPENIGGIDDDLSGVSCPSTSLCVAVSLSGLIVTSTTPKDEASWTAHLAGGVSFRAVACQPLGQCYALDATGNLYAGATSWVYLGGLGFDDANSMACAETGCLAVNDNGQAATWGQWGRSVETIASPGVLRGVTCTPTGLCMATSGANVWQSTNPAGGASTWHRTGGGSAPLNDASCASEALCVAVGSSGWITTSTNPGSGAPAWTGGTVGTDRQIVAVACPSESLCVAVDDSGWITSTRPAG